MKALIVYGTNEGQTRKVASFIKKEAENLGHKITLADATDNPPPPKGFDLVMIGASVHVGKYQSSVIHYVKEHIEELNKTIGVFFSVSMSAWGDDKESKKELEEAISNFVHDTGWKPHKIERIAGALRYTKYDFFKKWMIKSIAKKKGQDTDTSKDHEYTDWDAVKDFADAIFDSDHEEYIFAKKRNLAPVG